MPRCTARPPRPAYRCSECGWETAKWVGRCGECQAWGSVAEAAAARPAARPPRPVTRPAVPIGQVSVEESAFRSSGVPELDRVLGGGLVPGAAILLAGEPGVGKSTLLLEVAAQTARYQRRTLYVTGEESASQVRLRADRTGGVHDELLPRGRDRPRRRAHPHRAGPARRCWSSTRSRPSAPPGIDGVPGGVTQVKEVAAALIRVAKTRNITTVLVGHVTKDGSIAGPRVLEHLVDVVLHFEGDRNSRFRMVRAMKNRFGPIDEVGCFDLSADGITAVTDPTGLFVEHHHQQVPGTCVAVTMEGRRPLLAEVQALVDPHRGRAPAAHDLGLDSSRVAMVLAVLQQHCGIRAARPRRLRLHRRRRPAHPSRPATWPSRWRSPRATTRPARAPAAWSRWARSAWPASCAGCATCPSGWPRRPGSASRSPWCPASRGGEPGPARRADGRRDAGRSRCPTSPPRCGCCSLSRSRATDVDGRSPDDRGDLLD